MIDVKETLNSAAERMEMASNVSRRGTLSCSCWSC